MGKKFITILVYSPEAGANPFHHTSIMFSEYRNPGETVTAVNSYGFYGSPLIPIPEGYLELMKNFKFEEMYNKRLIEFKRNNSLGVDLFSGNQGKFEEEELRFQLLGEGLRELTIEVTDKKWKSGIKKCQEIIRLEKEAREEYCKELGIDFKDWPKKSLEIFQLAEMRGDKRLRPFVIKFGERDSVNFEYKSDASWVDLFCEMVRQWTNVNPSFICKNYACEILDELGIPKQILNAMTENGKWPALPRFGGNYKPALFYADGELLEHPSEHTGKIYYYYDRSNGTQSHWMLPPQNLFSFDDEFVRRTTIPEKYFQDLRLLVSTLQKLENFIVNQGRRYHRCKLMSDIRSALRFFSRVPLNYSDSTYEEYIYNVRRLLIEVNYVANQHSFPYKFDVKFIIGFDQSVLNEMINVVEPAFKPLREFSGLLLEDIKKAEQIEKIIQVNNHHNIHTNTLTQIRRTNQKYKGIIKWLHRWPEAKALNENNVLDDIYWTMTDYMHNPKVDVRSLARLPDAAKEKICGILGLGWAFDAGEYNRQELAWSHGF